MADGEEVRVKFVADLSGFSKGVEKVKKKMEETKKTAEQATSKWSKLSEVFSKFSPTLKGLQDKFDEVTDGMNEAFGGTKASAGIMKVAVIAAVAAVATAALKAVWNIMDETAKAFDSRSYDKAVGEREQSMKKFKTAVGAFTSPIFTAINKVISVVLDGLTWVLKQVYSAFNLVYGFIKGLLTPVINAVKAAIDAVAKALQPVVDAIKSAINGLAAFLGFGLVFQSASEGAEEIADSMEDVGEEAEYAVGNLSSFDKLNSVDLTGDVDTAESMKESAEAMQKLGEGWAQKLLDKLGKIADWFKNLDLGAIWDGFVDAATRAWNWVKSLATTAWNGIVSIATTAWNIISSIGNTIWNGILTVGTTVWNTLTSIATTAWNTVYSVAMTIWNAITSTVTALWNGVVSFFTSAWDGATSFVRGIIDGAMEWFSMDWSEKWTAITETFKSIWDAVTGWLRSIFDKLFGWIQDTIDGIMDSVRWVLDKVDAAKNAVSNAVGSVVGGIKNFLGIGGAASGAVVAPNNPHLIKVGDNTRETEIISPLSTMKQAMKEAMVEMGGVSGGSKQPVELVIKMNGKVMAREMFDDLASVARQKGRTIA